MGDISIGYFAGMWDAWKLRYSAWSNRENEEDGITAVANKVIERLKTVQEAEMDWGDWEKPGGGTKDRMEPIKNAFGMLNHLTKKQYEKVLSILGESLKKNAEIDQKQATKEEKQEAAGLSNISSCLHQCSYTPISQIFLSIFRLQTKNSTTDKITPEKNRIESFKKIYYELMQKTKKVAQEILEKKPTQ